MKLIIILLALVLERGCHWGQYLYRFNWFIPYLKFLESSFAKTGAWKGFWGMFITLAPILVVVGVIELLLFHPLYGLLAALYSLFILVYCFGPADFMASVNHYLVAQAKEEVEAAQKDLAQLMGAGGIPIESGPRNRLVTCSIFRQFNEGLFAVLFWFVILGPVGAVLYRVVCLTRSLSTQGEIAALPLTEAAIWCQGILDWIPIRLLALGFALAGNFVQPFTYWLQKVFTSWDQNQILLEEAGLHALNLSIEDSTTANFDENREAIALVDRVLIIFVVIIALGVLAALIV